MKVIGLTGGIGSGKSTVASFFAELGIPVYTADLEAKKLYVTSKVVQKKIIALLGKEAYKGGELNRGYIAKRIFGNDALLQQVNAIIHPKVRAHFKRWLKKQQAPYCIKEAAILFENKGHLECDQMILVTAPEDVRIERLKKRDHATLEEIKERMRHQWPDEKKIPLADYLIENKNLNDTKKQVLQIHKMLLKR
ncbi:MAG: dephospho-CoA kinase [Flavobacteriaceae bacterium]